MTTPPSGSQTLAKSVAIVLVLGGLTAAGYGAFVKGPSDLGHNIKEETLDAANRGLDWTERLAKDIDQVLHITPRVTRDGTVIIHETAAIAELSTVERKFSDEYLWEQAWLGSTKRIKLSGDFVAKAGYDLSQPFSIDISRDGKTIRAGLPPAKLLSLEELHERVLQDEEGIWNKLTPADRENVKNEFLKHARAQIAESDILAEADQKLTTQLENIIRKNSPQPVTIQHHPAPAR